MLEATKSITFEGKKYNKEAHVASLIKVNCEICQEVRRSIQFLSLLISIEMTYIFPISEVAFTSSTTPTMKRFNCFIMKGKVTSSISSLRMLDS